MPVIRGKEARAFLRKLGIEPESEPKAPKYNNEKIKLDGRVFDSQREAERFCQLKALLRAGEISDLELQKTFVLIPSQKGADGKVAERAVTYKADFWYYDKRTRQYVCEDTKGVRTKEYVIKRKLMLYVHNIKIIEL